MEKVDTASEALALSIGEKAGVDLEFISALCGKTEPEVVEELQGVIFRNPVTHALSLIHIYAHGTV